jgi:hypothetical protein
VLNARHPSVTIRTLRICLILSAAIGDTPKSLALSGWQIPAPFCARDPQPELLYLGGYPDSEGLKQRPQQQPLRVDLAQRWATLKRGTQSKGGGAQIAAVFATCKEIPEAAVAHPS